MEPVVIIELAEEHIKLLPSGSFIMLEAYDKANAEKRALIYKLRDLVKRYSIERAEISRKIDEL